MTIEAFLKEKGVGYEKHAHAQAFTAQRLADAEHVSGYAVAKPVIVKGARGFSMCVLAAPKHLNLERVARALGERDVRLASEAELAEIFGDCELGAEPPIGALYGLRTVVDEQLRGSPELILQAGTHTESIKMSGEDYERVCDAEYADITSR